MRSLWGQGYATEAAGALLDWIYRVEPVDHVIGFAVAEHGASRRVLEKAGMVFTGIRNVDGIPNAFYRHNRPVRGTSGSGRIELEG
jgi:RimJ/RimL family protein N-acetyltransferase